MIRVRDGSGSAQIARVRVRDASNALAEIGVVRVRDGSGLSVVFDTFSATVAPRSVYGYGYSKVPVTVSTTVTTVTPKGGVPPYTYAWSGSGAPWSIGSTTAQSTFFRRSGVGAGDSYNGTFTCVVTDAAGNSVSTPSVSANVSNDWGV